MYGHQHAGSGTGAGSEQHSYYLPNSSPSVGNSNFPSPLFFDSSFTDSPQHLQPPARVSPSTHRTGDSEMSRGGLSDKNPESSKPRVLPSRDVNAKNIADVYVLFILYCNPQFGMDVDTAILRSNFLAPPKSDDNSFETFDLFRLITKLDSKEIKTWGQLALDLGVRPPDPSKGQSSQKVQQYTVRLKRWMRAMHIDAFFEYLLGKRHNYFTEIPPASSPYPQAGRDGVQAEEDLAIRALEPNFRPKRGRRRNSDIEQEAAEISEKQADPTSSFPQSAHPDRFSADPWAIASAVTPQSLAPWSARAPQSAVTTATPGHLRWQLHGPASNTPSTPHPMSAIPTSMAAHIDAAFDNEPQSAVTPSSRKRRRHGPAVSSAWTAAINPGAKPRGRPPASRNVQEGPYGTFPSRPSTERSPRATSRDPESASTHREETPKPLAMPPPAPMRQNSSGSAGGKRMSLSLKVPENHGRPVRLATPPPTVLVNGESNAEESTAANMQRSRSDGFIHQSQNQSEQERSGLSTEHYASSEAAVENATPETLTASSQSQAGSSSLDFETLKRVLTSDLLRSDLTGRIKRLTGEEAKKLAQRMLERLQVPRASSGPDSSRDNIARHTAASWLGVGHHLNVPPRHAVSSGKKIAVSYFRTTIDGYEEPVSAREIDNSTESGLRELFNVSWRVSMGACTGSFECKDIELGNEKLVEAEDEHDMVLRYVYEAANRLGVRDGRWAGQAVADYSQRRQLDNDNDNDNSVDWKERYMALEFGTKLVRGELERMKGRILENVLEALT